jgi:hypothetical protein
MALATTNTILASNGLQPLKVLTAGTRSSNSERGRAGTERCFLGVCYLKKAKSLNLLAGGTTRRGASRKVLDGLDRCPGSFFCGTVVPAIAASNPHIQFRQIYVRNQWGIRFKFSVPRF